MSKEVFETILQMAEGDRRLDAGGTLFAQGDPVRWIYVLRSGSIRLVRYGQKGDTVVLQRARAGDVVAEASAYSPLYHCAAECVEAADAAAVPVSRFLERVSSDPVFAEEWAAFLAGSVQVARARAEILAARTVHERLSRWRAWFGDMPERGRWMEVAAEIGVTPEALYRALAKAGRG